MRNELPQGVILSALFAAVIAACSSKPSGSAPAQSGSTSATPAGANATPAAAVAEHRPAPERSGGALRRSVDGARLYVADEDHKVIRVLAFPLSSPPNTPSGSPSSAPNAPPSASAALSAARPSPSARAAHPPEPPKGPIPPIVPPDPIAHQEAIAMPGAPAQVLPLDGMVLATVRDKGLLLVMKEAGDKLEEDARIEVAPDAWGVAVSKDEGLAVVTSAWTHTVTGVDLNAKKVLWTLDVAREPRGVVIHPDGKRAFISHLTSSDITRIDDIASATPKATTVPLPPAPSRTPVGATLTASLAYALVLDDGGNRLLASRHALGATAEEQASMPTWFGTPTLDVLQTETNKPLLSPRTSPEPRVRSTPAFEKRRQEVVSAPKGSGLEYYARHFTAPAVPLSGAIQPRDMIVEHKTQSVWVASEGQEVVVEYPLMAAAPMEMPLRSAQVGGQYQDPNIVAPYGEGIPGVCGAPTGLALSADEDTLYVFCRSTYDIAAVAIAGEATRAPDGSKGVGEIRLARLAEDPLGEKGSAGRRLFYSGHDRYSSDELGCASCHPDGRDDGHVWHEIWPAADAVRDKPSPHFLASETLADETHDGRLGYARQTPMLAGRVSAEGPYGWHAQNASLGGRIAEGFGLHSWFGGGVDPDKPMTAVRTNALKLFLREGLVAPPKPSRPLTDQEKQGKEIFESDAAQCATCHVPATEFTNRAANPLKQFAPPPGFEEEHDDKFKTPSLLFIGGTAPYFHDGRAPTLAALVAQNQDRMGHTTQLSEDQRAALVAYLETL